MADVRVMIVDDDALVAFHLQKTILSLGYEVSGIFASGEEAIAEVPRQKPDVILMDVQLRDKLSGIETAKLIREQHAIPVVFVSAFSDDVMLMQACMTEPYGYLIKPVKERELHATIEMALYKGKMDKQYKNLTRVLYAVRDVNQLITRERNINRLMSETARILVDHRAYHMVWIALFGKDQSTLEKSVMAGGDAEVQDGIAAIMKEPSTWPPQMLLSLTEKKARTCVKANGNAEAGIWEMPAFKDKTDAFAFVPVVYQTSVYGIIWVGAGSAELFNSDEVGLLEELAGDLAFSIQSIHEEDTRRKAEEALAESEERMRLIVEQTGQMIYDYNIPENRIKWAGATEDITGMSLHEFEETTMEEWAQLIHPDDRTMAIDLLDKAIKEVEQYHVVYRFKHRDGAYRYIEDTGVIVTDIFGKARRMIGSMKNITEQKLTEDALLSSELRFRQLFVEAPLGYQSLDSEGVFLDVNKTWLNLLGYNRFEVIGKRFIEFIEPSQQKSFKEGFMRFLERGETNTVLRLKHKKGHLLTIEFAGRVGMDASGDFKQTHCILKDITEKVKVEKELLEYKQQLEGLVKERTANLNHALSMLNATLESTPNGIVVMSLEGKVTKVNNHFFKMFEIPVEYQNNIAFDFLLERIREKIQPEHDSVAHLMNMFNTGTMQESVELAMADGCVYECFTFPQMMNDEMIGKIWTFSDITHRKQIESELIVAKNQAETASRAKSEFLANMSHEIRTPMNAVIGFADLLDRKVEQPELKNYIRSIRSSGHTLLHIINDILDISKIEAGRMEIQREPIRLQTVFSEIETMFSMKVAEKMLSFKTEIPKDFPFAIIIDELRLQQIMLNIVGNAVKFTEKGGIKIKASFSRKGESVISLRIDVADTGIGIDPNNFNRIFEAFMQQDIQDQKKYGGTGLGLYISKRLAELMGGTISVSGKPGKGSTFSIMFEDLPVYEKKLEKKEEDVDYSNIWFDNQIVLIVDDVETNRNLVRSMLSDLNLVVIEAHNGLEAVKMAKIYNPDLIFMDIRMPVMDGYAAAKAIKEEHGKRRMPIISLTASSVESSMEAEEMDLLFDGYLRKPVLFADVVGEMVKHLDFSERVKDEPLKEKTSGKKQTSKKKISGIKELASRIEKEVIPTWERLTKRVSMKETVEFAELIAALGREYKVDALRIFAEELQMLIKSFDVAQIKDQLLKFPGMLKDQNILNM
jgi:PAS domain S-box-containing protein